MAASPNLLPPEWSIADLIRAAAHEQEPMNQVVRLSKAVPEQAGDTEASWTETWELVADAVESVRSNDERIATLESRNRDLETTYADEVGALQARMKAVEQILDRTESARAAAEERASHAEARATSAEGVSPPHWRAGARDPQLKRSAYAERQHP